MGVRAVVRLQLELLLRSRAFWLVGALWLALTMWMTAPEPGLGQRLVSLRTMFLIWLPAVAVHAQQLAQGTDAPGRSWQHVLAVPAPAWLLGQIVGVTVAFVLFPALTVVMLAAEAWLSGSAVTAAFLAFALREGLVITAAGCILGLLADRIGSHLQGGAIAAVGITVLLILLLEFLARGAPAAWMTLLAIQPLRHSLALSELWGFFPDGALAAGHHMVWALLLTGLAALLAFVHRPHVRSVSLSALVVALMAWSGAGFAVGSVASELETREEMHAAHLELQPGSEEGPSQRPLTNGRWQVSTEVDAVWHVDDAVLQATARVVGVPLDDNAMAEDRLAVTLRHTAEILDVTTGGAAAAWERDGNKILLARAPMAPPSAPWEVNIRYRLGDDGTWIDWSLHPNTGSHVPLGVISHELLWLPGHYAWYPLFGYHELMQVVVYSGGGELVSRPDVLYGRPLGQYFMGHYYLEKFDLENNLRLTVEGQGDHLSPGTIVVAPKPEVTTTLDEGRVLETKGPSRGWMGIYAAPHLVAAERRSFVWHLPAAGRDMEMFEPILAAGDRIYDTLHAVVPREQVDRPTITVVPDRLLPEPRDEETGPLHITLPEGQLGTLAELAGSGFISPRPPARRQSLTYLQPTLSLASAWWGVSIPHFGNWSGVDKDAEIRAGIARFHAALAVKELAGPEFYDVLVTRAETVRDRRLDRAADESSLNGDGVSAVDIFLALVHIEVTKGSEAAVAMVRALHEMAQAGSLTEADVRDLMTDRQQLHGG